MTAHQEPRADAGADPAFDSPTLDSTPHPLVPLARDGVPRPLDRAARDDALRLPRTVAANGTPWLLARAPAIGPPPPGIDARVRRITLRSAALGIRKSFYVFLPPEHGQAGRRLPVLYLLRGHEREWVNPTEDGTRRGTVIDVYQRLRAAGTIGPMILVFPGVSSDDNRFHGMATDFRARALAPDVRGLGTGRFETYLVHELIPLVDALFATLPGPRHRGVAGFSLGGFMAVKLAAQHPGLFATAGAYDGTFLYADDSGTHVKEDDGVFNARFLDPVYGRPRDRAHAAANNPANLIIKANAADLAAVRWLIQYGPRRAEPMGSNYYRGAYLRGLLAERGVRFGLPAVRPDGAHSWAVADRYIEATLPLHWRVLRSSEDSVDDSCTDGP